MRSLQDQGANEEVRKLADGFARLKQECPLLDGNLIPRTLTMGAATRIRHRLDRPWVGCFVVALLNAAGPGYIHVTHGPSDDSIVTVTAVDYTSDPQLLLWVF